MGFFGFLTAMTLGLISLSALFLVLLAWPKSPVRDFCLRLMYWLLFGVSALLFLSPLDLLPLIPVDDWLLYLPTGVTAAWMAMRNRAGAKPALTLEKHDYRDVTPQDMRGDKS